MENKIGEEEMQENLEIPELLQLSVIAVGCVYVKNKLKGKSIRNKFVASYVRCVALGRTGT